MNKYTLSRVALSLVCLLLAGETFLLLFGAAYGYGYRGFSDKTEKEMVFIYTEMAVNLFALSAFVIAGLLVWRKKPVGKWFYGVLIVPLLTLLWWAYQCQCLSFYEFVPLPVIGVVAFWLNRKLVHNTLFQPTP